MVERQQTLAPATKLMRRLPSFNGDNSASRLLICSGILLTLSGLLHIPIWLLEQSPWEGSVSWRKPILFGISTGMTLWSLGWIVDKVKLNRADHVTSWLVSVSLILEVGLITVQQWRGRASHFNQTTPFDRWIDSAMVGLIVVAFIGIIYFTFRSFGELDLTSDYKFAARMGMVFLVLSCVIGFAISFHGYARVDAGLNPETYGKRGATKFPHGVVIHALQLLPFVVFLLHRLDVSRKQCLNFVRSLSAALFLLLAFSIYQTLNGLSRFEMSLPGLALLGTAGFISMLPLVQSRQKHPA